MFQHNNDIYLKKKKKTLGAYQAHFSSAGFANKAINCFSPKASCCHDITNTPYLGWQIFSHIQNTGNARKLNIIQKKNKQNKTKQTNKQKKKQKQKQIEIQTGFLQHPPIKNKNNHCFDNNLQKNSSFKIS